MKHAEVANKEICKDVQHLEDFFQAVLKGGGEGVILRDPKSLYQPGRSASFLKHKVYMTVCMTMYNDKYMFCVFCAEIQRL